MAQYSSETRLHWELSRAQVFPSSVAAFLPNSLLSDPEIFLYQIVVPSHRFGIAIRIAAMAFSSAFQDKFPVRQPISTAYPSEGLADSKFDPVDVTNTTIRAPDGESVDAEIPDGVKQAQATTIVWSRNALIVVYALSVILCCRSLCLG